METRQIFGFLGMLAVLAIGSVYFQNQVPDRTAQTTSFTFNTQSVDCVQNYDSINYDHHKKLTMTDAQLLRSYILGSTPDSCPSGKICDINGDGSLDDADLMFISSYMLGTIKGFEVCGDGVDNDCNDLVDDGCPTINS